MNPYYCATLNESKELSAVENCVFCQIIKGDIPAHKIYEDDKTLAFLNIRPAVEGFTMVIPKIHSDFIWDTTPEDYVAILETVKKVGLRIREVYKPHRVGIQFEALDVTHTHAKVFPFSSAAEFRKPDSAEEPDHQKLAAVAQKLAFS